MLEEKKKPNQTKTHRGGSGVPAAPRHRLSSPGASSEGGGARGTPESKGNPPGASAVTHHTGSQPTPAFRSPPQARSGSDTRVFRGSYKPPKPRSHCDSRQLAPGDIIYPRLLPGKNSLSLATSWEALAGNQPFHAINPYASCGQAGRPCQRDIQFLKSKSRVRHRCGVQLSPASWVFNFSPFSFPCKQASPLRAGKTRVPPLLLARNNSVSPRNTGLTS